MRAQLAFAFRPPALPRATELLPNAAQDEARTWLDRTTEWPLRRLAIWGAPGTGKTHLLHSWAERTGGTVLRGPPETGWPRGPLALDGLDAVRDELSLLYLLNAASEARQPLLLASSRAPGRLPIRLPDLASRLRATTAVRVGAAPEAFLRLLLQRLLAERQLVVAAPLRDWLLCRLPRTPEALHDAVERLDAAGLQFGRAVTRALAVQVLDLELRIAEDARDNCVPAVPGPSRPAPAVG